MISDNLSSAILRLLDQDPYLKGQLARVHAEISGADRAMGAGHEGTAQAKIQTALAILELTFGQGEPS